MKLSEVKTGRAFKIGEMQFIKFLGNGNMTVVVARDIAFNSVYGENNNFSQSEISERLNKEILPKIEKEIGKENILEFETDLTSLDGLKTYGTMKSRISIPTFDFYRNNIEIFDMHKLDCYWWLATPDTTKEHGSDRWNVCVSPNGNFYSDDYNGYDGVRPFLNLVSSISVSCEE